MFESRLPSQPWPLDNYLVTCETRYSVQMTASLAKETKLCLSRSVWEDSLWLLD